MSETRPLTIDTIVKIGSAPLRHPDALGHVARALEVTIARRQRVLVIPGGGPFADAVRSVDRSLHLDPDTAHWMAILGMDQYAHLLAARLPAAHLVDHPSQITSVIMSDELPVIAPYRWLHEADPLPHSWNVTSDSIAAWIAGGVGARRLVLVKPVVGDRDTLVDPYFERVMPAHLEVAIADADGLSKALRREEEREMT